MTTTPRTTPRTLRTLGSMLIVVLLAAVPIQAADRWLHVRVHEDGYSGASVNINVPIALIEAILPTIETREFRDGRVHLGFDEFEDIDLRQLAESLRDAPDAEYITVKTRDEDVRIAKDGGFLLVNVDELHGDRVRIKLPMEVLDAMLSNGANVLDLGAGLRALADYDGDDLITVESEDTSVRIWIDSSESGDR